MANEDTVAVYRNGELVAIYESEPHIAWREALIEARSGAGAHDLFPCGTWAVDASGPHYTIGSYRVQRIASPGVASA